MVLLINYIKEFEKMNPQDPAAIFGINNFDRVNFNDQAQWGFSYDIAAMSRDKAVTADTIVTLPIANYKLDRNKTHPQDWVINFRRVFKSGTNLTPSVFGPEDVFGSLLLGGGNFSYETTWMGAPLPIGWGVGSGLAYIPPYGCAWHVNCEAITVSIRTTLRTAWKGIPNRVDKIIGWISRGRPSERIVTKVIFTQPANSVPATIPDGAVSCKVAGFTFLGAAPFPRANTSIVFSSIMPEVPVGTPVGINAYGYTILATDNNNEIPIPATSYAVWDNNAGTNTYTQLSFKCIT